MEKINNEIFESVAELEETVVIEDTIDIPFESTSDEKDFESINIIDFEEFLKLVA